MRTNELEVVGSRPLRRTVALPRGPSRQDRDALVRAIAEALIEIHTWPSHGEVEGSSFVILDTEVGGKLFYAQFLSKPAEDGLLSELASGFYGDASSASSFRATPEQARAMVSNGFSSGLEGNFRKRLVFDTPDAAAAIAEQTLTILGSVFGWSPESPVTM